MPDGFGCTDSTALNFDPDAIEDDGSCQYPIDCSGLTAVTIDVGGGSWQEEVSWSIQDFQVCRINRCLFRRWMFNLHYARFLWRWLEW